MILLKAKSYGRSKRRPHRGHPIVLDRNRQLEAVRAQDQLKTAVANALQRKQAEYEAGSLTANELLRQWQAILGQAYRSAFRHGLQASGQVGELTAHDERYLKTFRQQEWGYLRRFVSDIREGQLRMPLSERLEMYVKTVDSAYWAGRVEGEPEDVQIKWNLSPAEHCDDCIQLALNSPYTRANLPTQPRSGATSCKSNCRCFLTFEPTSRAVLPSALAPRPSGFVSPLPEVPSTSGTGAVRATHTQALPPAPDVRLRITLPQVLGNTPAELARMEERVQRVRQAAEFPSERYTNLAGWLVGLILGAASQAGREQDRSDLARRYQEAGVLPIGSLYNPTEVWTVEQRGASWEARANRDIVGEARSREEAYAMLRQEAMRQRKTIPVELIQGEVLQRSRIILLKARTVRAYKRVDPKTGQVVYVKEHTDRRDPRQLSLFSGREVLHLTHEQVKRPARAKVAPAATPGPGLFGDLPPEAKRPSQPTRRPAPTDSPLFAYAEHRKQQPPPQNPRAQTPYERQQERLKQREQEDAAKQAEKLSGDEIEQHPAPTVGMAIRALANVDDRARSRDAAGYSMNDTNFGQHLASINETDWSAKQRYAAWQMVRKYRAQLGRMGIDYDKIPVPPNPVQIADLQGKADLEHAKQQEAEASSPEEKNLALLTQLMAGLGGKGIKVRMGRTQGGKDAIEIRGDTYPHLKKFQAIKGKGVFGQKNERGFFAWWTTHADIGKVITHFGGTPYDLQSSGRDVPGPGARPAGVSGAAGNTEHTVDTGDAARRGDGGTRGDGQQRDDGRTLPGGQTGVRGGQPQQPESGTEAGKRVDTARPGSGLTGVGTIAELLAVAPPEPQSSLHPDLAGKLLTDQEADVRLMADALARGDRGFLLGSVTGSGKTYTGLGAIKQLGAQRALIIVPNQGIANQWVQIGKDHFGMELTEGAPTSPTQPGIFVSTYAGLRQVGKIKGVSQPKGKESDRRHAALGKFDVSIADEVHREAMKLRERRGTAVMIARIGDDSQFMVHSTATPIEKPQDAEYLFSLGLWRNKSGFKAWTENHGVRWDTKKVPQRGGGSQTVWDLKFIGHPRGGKVQSMLQIRADIVGAGKGVFRELHLDVPLHSEFASVPMSASPYHEQVSKALRALNNLPEGGLYSAARTNYTKRLLDYIKLDEAVDVAAEAVEKGYRVPVFVSNVAPLSFDMPDAEDMEELGPIAQEIREAFHRAGLAGSLPSPVESMVQKLRDRMGKNAVEPYTGQVSSGKREKTKKAFNEGKLKVVVSTIAAGGTGLSLHDIEGDKPRYQVNVGLPWSGKDFQQLLGRTYRYGTKSPVTQHFLFTDHPGERRLASIVGGKVESMGATTRGVTSDTNVNRLAEFSLGGAFTDLDDTSETMQKSYHMILRISHFLRPQKAKLAG